MGKTQYTMPERYILVCAAGYTAERLMLGVNDPGMCVSDMREAMWGYLQSAVSRLHEPEYYLTYARNHLNRFVAARDALV